MGAQVQPAFTEEFVMTYKTMMLGKIRREQATTRKVIASIPKDNQTYKPDPKSRTGLELASHIVDSEIWFLNSIAEGRFDWSEPTPQADVKAVLARYDAEFLKAWEKADATNAKHLLQVVDFFGMKMANFFYLSFAESHTVHHRGQLSAYLRAMGGKVPDIYGGSADEPWQQDQAST
jgi:uncharacterized damage-inducible protein DinB